MYWGYFYKSENDTILHSILVTKNTYDKLCELLVRYKNDTDGNFKYACKNELYLKHLNPMSYTYNKIVNAGNVNINENYVKNVSNMPVLQ